MKKVINKEKENPFLANFQKKVFSPRVPGTYNAKEQMRMGKSGKPAAEWPPGGVFGTTRTGEHAQEC